MRHFANTPVTATIGLLAILAASACAQRTPSAPDAGGTASTGPLRPAPVPSLSTVGAPDAPSFGPGVGGGIDTGVGVDKAGPARRY